MNNKQQNNIEKIVHKIGIDTKDYWIKVFSTLPPHEVGVIKASGKLLSQPNLTVLCEEMAYIAKEAGLYLPLVIGGGVQYDKLFTGKSKKVKGIRCTDYNLMEKINAVAEENQINVVKSFKEIGVDAVSISPEAIKVLPHGIEFDKNEEAVETGFVGDIISINTKEIISAIYNKQIPIISHIGTNNGQKYNINATSVAKELVKFLQAKKLIVVGDTPIYNKDNELIRKIYSELEFKKLMRGGVIRGGMITNCTEAYDLLNYLGPGHSVQITSLKKGEDKKTTTTGLLEELLGNGCGTMLMTPSIITQYPIDAIDKNLLIGMIDGAFEKRGKKLTEGYFENIYSKEPTVYLDAQKKGGAITYPIEGTEYICKIFTDKDYEGLGISNSIISTIWQHKNSFAWRTGIDNTQKSICNYKKIAAHYNGFSEEVGKYIIFGVGIDKSLKSKVINIISKIPVTLEAIK